MTKAYVRPDLITEGLAPPILIDGEKSFMPAEWLSEQFDCEQPDHLDNEEYNVVLKRLNGQKFRGYSVDYIFF